MAKKPHLRTHEASEHIQIIGLGAAGEAAAFALKNFATPGLKCQVYDPLALGDGFDPPARPRTDAKSRIDLSPDTQIEHYLKMARNLRDTYVERLTDTDLVIIVVDTGSDVGAGTAHVLADAARETGTLTISIAIMPSVSAPEARKNNASKAFSALKATSDVVLPLSYDDISPKNGRPVLTLDASIDAVDELAVTAVRAIVELITVPGIINIDLADLRETLSDQVLAMVGVGKAEGPDRARRATEAALSQPRPAGIEWTQARSVLVNLTAGPDMSIQEVQAVGQTVERNLGQDEIGVVVRVLLGTVIDEAHGETLTVTVFGAGLHTAVERRAKLGTNRRVVADAAKAVPAEGLRLIVDDHVPASDIARLVDLLSDVYESVSTD